MNNYLSKKVRQIQLMNLTNLILPINKRIDPTYYFFHRPSFPSLHFLYFPKNNNLCGMNDNRTYNPHWPYGEFLNICHHYLSYNRYNHNFPSGD